MSVASSELYNDLLETYFDEYYDLWDEKGSKIDPKYNPTNLTLDEYDYNEWYKEIELDDSPTLELEGDKEKQKKGKS